ncbi:MAG: preprotein translocase subunit SecY [Phototrophicaceae bacterium]
MLQALRNAFRIPEVRNKLIFTGLVILVYRFIAHVPVLGVDKSALTSLLNSSEAGGLVGVLNLLSGGAVSNFSIIANGVYPYITASIIFQLLVPAIPALEAIQREPGGQEKIQRYTYYLAIPMAMLQSVAQINIFNLLGGVPIIPGFGSDLLLTLTVIASMTAGTMLAIWMGELITQDGLGNGISIIIFAGIVATAPTSFLQLMQNTTGAYRLYNIVMFILITLISLVVIILIQEGVRRIPVNYGKRVRGQKMYGGQSSYIPLKINPVGMIPLIFAQSMITFPAILVSLLPANDFTRGLTRTFGDQSGFWYWLIFFTLTVAFTFFYSDVMVQQQNLSENLQRQGGFIPGIRPGKRTQDYIQKVTRRVTVVGAVFLGVIAILPGIVGGLNSLFFGLQAVTGVNAAQVVTGSGLIIVVGVVIDTLRQLEAQMVMRNYDGFMR